MTYQELQTEARNILSNIKQFYEGPEADVEKYTMIKEWGDNGVTVIVAKRDDAPRADRLFEGRVTSLRRRVNWKKMAKAVQLAAME